MALDLILQEAKGMSDEELMEVLRYMRFIKIESIRNEETKQEKRKIRTGGIYHGKIRIAEDFDEPLDDFKEYM